MRIHELPKRPVLRLAILSLGLALATTGPARSDDPARELAERFAEPTAKAKAPAAARRRPTGSPTVATVDEQRLLDEIDMLERARAEAETRRSELMRAREAAERADQAGGDVVRNAERDRLLDAERRAAEQQAEASRKLEETRRRAEEQRKAEDARRVAEEQRRAEEARRVAEEQRRAEEARRVAEEQKAEDARRVAMEAEREAEAERIAETLRQARVAREADRRSNRAVAEEGSSASGWSRDAGEVFRPDQTARQDRMGLAGPHHHRPTRVTVLLRLEPGSYGIRRHNKTADPLLCSDQGCYVSAGLVAPADLLHKRRALGVRRTLGGRAGACRDSLGCVFRGIELDSYPAMVQPIDMHVLKHDRRQPQMLDGTSDCAIVRDRLTCRRPYRGPDYVLWVVPEPLAEMAGPGLLERAVEDGLPEGEQAAVESYR